MEARMRETEIRTAIKTVYAELWELFSRYESSEAYNKVPDGVRADAADYWAGKLMNIRRSAASLFLGEDLLRRITERILDEAERFLKAYEVPGVVTRWKQINPRMLYFDCCFELARKEPDLCRKITRGLTPYRLSCCPDEELVREREHYFSGVRRKEQCYGQQYSEERIFQDELLRTLTMVFEQDFKEYL